MDNKFKGVDKDTRKVLKALMEDGFTVRKSSKGHPLVFKDGRLIATLSGTASDRRSYQNGLSKLRKAGFQWPRG